MIQNKLETLAALSTKKEKEQFLLENWSDATFKTTVSFLLDPNVTTGLSTKKMGKKVPEIASSLSSLEDAYEFLAAHNTGDDETIGVIQGFIKNRPEDDEFLKQLFAKTLRLGVSISTLQKLFPDEFKEFSVQLAFPYQKKSHLVQDKMFVATQKLDGFRLVAQVKDGQVKFFTRKGKAVDGLEEVEQAVLAALDDRKRAIAEEAEIDFSVAEQWLGETIIGDIVLDGEALAVPEEGEDTLQTFRRTSKIMRTNGPKTGIVFNGFDILPLEEFEKGESSLGYLERRHSLSNLLESEFFKVVPVLGQGTVDNIPEWMEVSRANGWEGIMLNDVEAKYLTKRTPGLLKVKDMFSADLEVVGFVQAIDGKYKGQLKALEVKLDDANIVQVGSGLTDELRKEIWENQDDYLGKIAEIQYVEFSENQDGGKSLRFPVFIDFRSDKTVEDVNVE